MVKIKHLFRSQGQMMRDLQEQAYINAENEKQSVLSARHGEVPDDLKGTIYEDQWKNNPYRDLYYQPELWDYLNLSNKAKDANFNAEQKYNEYVAGIYDQKRQDEYNSESAKADRMRQAGQNPDLLGLSGASTTDEMNPNHTPPDPALNGQSPAVSGLSLISSILGFATDALQKIQGIKGLIMDNDIKDFSSFMGMIEPARNSIIGAYADRYGLGFPVDMEQRKKESSAIFHNRRLQKKFEKAWDHLLSNDYKVKEDAYKQYHNTDKAMFHVTEGIAKLEMLSLSHGFSAQQALSKFNQRYYSKLNPDAKAAGENRSYDNMGWLDKWRNEYYETLYNDMKNGSWLAGLILIGSAQSIPVGSRFSTEISKYLDKWFGSN